MVRAGQGGKLNRLFDIVDTAKFWAVLAIVLGLAIFAYSFGHNRAQASRNATVTTQHNAIIARQQKELTYLCETVATLDVLTTQQLRVTRETLRRTDLPAWGRDYLRKRQRILSTTHDELANSRGCRKVE